MGKKQERAPTGPIVFPRADPAELAKFDPSTKVCTMNCGPHAQDTRSHAERKFLCDDCLMKHEERQMSAADGGSWKPQQIEQIDWSGHGIAAELQAENNRLRSENERLRQVLGAIPAAEVLDENGPCRKCGCESEGVPGHCYACMTPNEKPKGQASKYGPENPPRLRKPGESVEEYRTAMGWSNKTPNASSQRNETA